MVKKILASLIVGLLFTSLSYAPAYANVTYSRTPSGFEVTSPVTISVSFDSASDTYCFDSNYNLYWDIQLWDVENLVGYSPVFPISELTKTFTLFLPVGTEVAGIGVFCTNDPLQDPILFGQGRTLEGTFGNVNDVLKVIPNSPTPTEQAENLVENVIEYDFPTSVENAYLANLKKIEKFIEEGKIQAAINQLQAFIDKVEADYTNGVITQSEYDNLISFAQTLLADLQ
jgi:hypothetical protein